MLGGLAGMAGEWQRLARARTGCAGGKRPLTSPQGLYLPQYAPLKVGLMLRRISMLGLWFGRQSRVHAVSWVEPEAQ